MLELTRRIIELLDAKEQTLRKLPKQKANHKRIFQIAYDKGLLITRAELLKSRGYEVTSVLGNEDAERALANSQQYRLFIVGHAAPREARERMVQWLKARYPNTKILALNPPYHSALPRADFNVELNGPEAWLAAVESATG